MKLDNLRPPARSKKRRKRVGRGTGSGHGKTSCRGHKGQNSRSGAKTKSWFEGGQMPLLRRVPKRGFTPISRLTYQLVNLRDVARCEGEITPETLKNCGLIKKIHRPVKILAHGEIERPMTVKAAAFSRSAREKIEAAGGKAEVI